MTNVAKKHEYYISKESLVKKRHCFGCNKVLHYLNKHIHVNIYNNPSVRFFCSKECKHQWIYKMSKRDDLKNV